VRLGQGNTSNVKTAGEGVLEYRIDWGPGYRVYFGRDGEVLVILLTGGTKKRQQRDIDRAKELWADYKRRRKPLSR
jgi:putative addiction module killer protein